MITLSDIGEIIYDYCRSFGVPLYLRDTLPVGDVTDERVVIIPKTIEDGKYWLRSFVEVNWLVPDIHFEANLRRIKDIERIMYPIQGTGTKDGTKYKYTRYSTSVENLSEANCHMVNVRILFNIQNVI